MITPDMLERQAKALKTRMIA